MIDENNYLKHRTLCKKCYNENRRKNNNTFKQILKTLTIITTILFQHMKTIVMSL